ncbi:hypothetical protein QQF64_000977 [Cirrhinus molitorella]|uniref:Uncharacterized protein n=1 Tax=Cirrhinus molitorella TaxID=172907 RepID=A0ABR3NZ36_9TELE
MAAWHEGGYSPPNTKEGLGDTHLQRAAIVKTRQQQQHLLLYSSLFPTIHLTEDSQVHDKSLPSGSLAKFQWEKTFFLLIPKPEGECDKRGKMPRRKQEQPKRLPSRYLHLQMEELEHCADLGSPLQSDGRVCVRLGGSPPYRNGGSLAPFHSSMIIMTLAGLGLENIGLRGKENEGRFPFRSWHLICKGKICQEYPLLLLLLVLLLFFLPPAPPT